MVNEGIKSALKDLHRANISVLRGKVNAGGIEIRKTRCPIHGDHACGRFVMPKPYSGVSAQYVCEFCWSDIDKA